MMNITPLSSSSSSAQCEEYVSITNPAKSKAAIKNVLRAGVRSGRNTGKGLSTVKTRLCGITYSGSSSTNTALQTTTPILFNATNIPELTSWVAVYDEARVLGGTVYYAMFSDGASISVANSPATGCVAVSFDIATGTGLTLSQVRSNTYSSPPLFVPNASLSGPFQVLAATPFHSLKFKMPSPQATLGTNNSPGSAWFELDSSLDANLLSIINYVGAIPANQTAIDFTFDLDVEFRMRV